MSKAETTLYSIGDDKLTAIADAIRSQTDDDQTMTTDDMVTKINSMLTAIEPYMGTDVHGTFEYIDPQYLSLELVEEPEDPDSGFDPTERPTYMLMYDGDLLDPYGGILARQGGHDKRINSEDISVWIRMENPEDERDSHTFGGNYGSGVYYFKDWDEDADQYSIQFDSWPAEPITYNCELIAAYSGSDFDLKNNRISVEFEFTLDTNPFKEEEEERE